MNKYEIHPCDLPKPGWKQRIRLIVLEDTMRGCSREVIALGAAMMLVVQVQNVLYTRKILSMDETCTDEVYADNKKWIDAWVEDAIVSVEENVR
jgi:hypothetical protein